MEHRRARLVPRRSGTRSTETENSRAFEEVSAEIGWTILNASPARTSNVPRRRRAGPSAEACLAELWCASWAISNICIFALVVPLIVTFAPIYSL